MKLQDCKLDVDRIHVYPLEIKKPQEEWIKPKNAGLIPESMFIFYCKADFFSISKAPPFLADKEKILFSFLANLARGMKDHLISAAENVEKIASLQKDIYTPIKRYRGESWEPKATKKQDEVFKLLLIDLYSCLDMFAEMVAMVFPGLISSLRLGRSSMNALYNFLKKDYSPVSKLVTPEEHHLQQLHSGMRDYLISDGTDKGWFELFKLYRNKLAHLGSEMFQKISLHDKDGEFYTFLPSHWPFIPQIYITNTADRWAKSWLKESIEFF